MHSGLICYQLPTFTRVTTHGSSQLSFLRDVADSDARDTATRALEVQVRSGDYFVTLATALDQLGKEVADHHVRVAVEDIVSDLIYLQDHYIITKNKNSEVAKEAHEHQDRTFENL